MVDPLPLEPSSELNYGIVFSILISLNNYLRSLMSFVFIFFFSAVYHQLSSSPSVTLKTLKNLEFEIAKEVQFY